MIPKWRGEHIVGGCEQKHEYLPQKHEDLPGATGAVRELGGGGGEEGKPGIMVALEDEKW